MVKESMRAVVLKAHGDTSGSLETSFPRPEPGPHEVRVRVAYAALNHLDLWVCRGVEGHSFPLPLILGSDGSGVVEALGSGVDSKWEGARVALMPGFGCGGCEACQSGREPACARYSIRGETCNGTNADFVLARPEHLMVLPEALSLQEAAAIPLAFQTAWAMLVDRVQIRPGETVLVHAGGSGVGSAAIQIARLFSARVAATASTEAKRAKALELGAEVCFDSRDPKLHRQTKAWTEGQGVDVVFEHVGQATWGASMKSLKKGGRLVTCGATTGHEVALDLRHVFFKSLSILGSTMGSNGSLRKIWRLVEHGKLKAVVDSVFDLEDIEAAHQHLKQSQQFGKVLLRLDPSAA